MVGVDAMATVVRELSERAHVDARPIVVKLDVEGAERELFSDPSWLDGVSIVTLEWHRHDGHVYRDILRSRGFDVCLEGGGPKPRATYDPSLGGGLLFAKRV